MREIPADAMAEAAVRHALERALTGVRRDLDGGAYRRAILAVSGGADSMALLHAASVVAPADRLVVATFDHGTGPWARSATELVASEAAKRGIMFVTARAGVPGTTEAEWRRQRWDFLRGVATRHRAAVLTAHTRDDNVETIFIRILRDAGPRGIASLYAPSPLIRPFLELSRTAVHAYAASHITFVTDPSNQDRRHLRNRIRLDLLPAIAAQRPSFGDELLAMARHAADWRARVEAIAATFTMMPEPNGSFTIPTRQFAGFSPAELRTLWPALAARAGVVMDRRGTHRLSLFTIECATGQSIQLSGGITVRARRDAIVLERNVPNG